MNLRSNITPRFTPDYAQANWAYERCSGEPEHPVQLGQGCERGQSVATDQDVRKGMNENRSKR